MCSEFGLSSSRAQVTDPLYRAAAGFPLSSPPNSPAAWTLWPSASKLFVTEADAAAVFDLTAEAGLPSSTALRLMAAGLNASSMSELSLQQTIRIAKLAGVEVWGRGLGLERGFGLF